MYVIHSRTGQTALVLGTGSSPAGVPNYHVRTLSGIETWWYQCDATEVK